MKRLLVLLFVVAFLVAIPLTHFAGKAAKVDVCHVNSANDQGAWGYAFGNVISVSEKAVPAHLAHGDSTDFFSLDEAQREWFEEKFDITLPNADCFFTVQ